MSTLCIERQKQIRGRNVVFNESSVLNQLKFMAIIDSEAGGSNDNSEIDCSSDEINSTNLDGAGNSKQLNHGVNSDNTGDITVNVNSAKDNCIGNNDGNVRRGERIRQKPDFYGVSANECDVHMALFTSQQTECESLALSAEQYVEDDPLSLSEAKSRADWPEWEKAIESEFHSLKRNDTWTCAICRREEKPSQTSGCSN